MDGELYWLWLDRLGIVLGVLTGLTWLIGLSLAFLRPEAVRNWFIRNRFPRVGVSRIEHVDAIVFTVSNPHVPGWVIQQLCPKTVGFIATEQSRDSAERLKKRAERQRILALEPLILNDPDDPRESRDCTAALLIELADQGALSVDVTGGKTPMSLGAFMAAEELGAKTLYVTCGYQHGKLDLRSAKIACISQPS